MSCRPKLSGYVFTDKLGNGSYATVYKAYAVKGDRREVVAVKCVAKSSLNKAATENLLTEISILKKLKHEYIVEMRDFLWDENYIYIIMEFCGAGDLSTFIKSRRNLPERVVKKFLQQLASALKYLRSENIAHMDLKPQNILLSSPVQPVVKLADFGFAQNLRAEEDASALRGSPLYMAPEILLNYKYDARVDLWSLGVILYECLFGRAPYSSKSFTELANKIKNPKPIQLVYGVDLSDECRDLVLRLLKRDPEERISFQDFFAHPFVDLEHMPSSSSYSTAVQVLKEAVTLDEEGKYTEAVKAYLDGLQHMIAAKQYEPSVERKATIGTKVSEYLSRAETLKIILKPKSTSNTYLEELIDLCSNSSPLSAALTVADAAEQQLKLENYQVASEKYQLALGVLIPLLADESKSSRRRELLHIQIQRWLEQAESLKKYISVDDEYPAAILMDDDDSKNNLADSLKQQCSIQ